MDYFYSWTVLDVAHNRTIATGDGTFAATGPITSGTGPITSGTGVWEETRSILVDGIKRDLESRGHAWLESCYRVHFLAITPLTPTADHARHLGQNMPPLAGEVA